MAINTPDTPTSWSPDVVAFAARDIVPEALILSCTTVAGQVDGDAPAVRVPVVAQDPAAGFVNEGAPITPTDGDYSEAVVTTGAIRVLSQFSLEQIGQPGAAGMIQNSMTRSVVTAANNAFLRNNTSPLGLLNHSDTVDGGQVGDDLDALVDALVSIEAAGGQATHIIASPQAWGYLSRLKTGTGSNSPLIGSGSGVGDAPQRQLLGVPVLTTPAMPVGGLLALDSASIVSAVGPVNVARSDDYAFNSHAAAVRVSFRFGYEVVNPGQIVSLTTGEDESSSSSGDESSSSSSS